MIHVVAIITAKPGMREEVLKVFRANVPLVLAEEGCIEYVPTIDTKDAGGLQTSLGADTFVVMEKWSSLQALHAHTKAPHMARYAERVKDLLAARVIHVLSPVG